jgi:uncharacterized protein HemX
MAEPKPVDTTSETNAPDESPKLVAVSENTTTPDSASGPAEPEKNGVPRLLFAIVAVLLLLVSIGLYAQTRRASAQAEQIASLGNQIEGLEVQLSAANTQIATYDMQLALVQDSVRDMYEKMGSLLDLVSAGPVLGESETPARGAAPNEGGSLELR